MSRFIPRGVAVAGLGRRFLAALIDAVPPALVAAGAGAVLALQDTPSATVVLVTTIAVVVLDGAYGLYQWWAYGTRGAGLGARIMGLRLVGMGDGQPVGWWRFFVRQLVFAALMGTVVGGIALLVFLVIHERRQGWHDMAVGAIVVEPKADPGRTPPAGRKAQAPSTVGLPPHLSSSFSPQVGSTKLGAAEAGNGPGPHAAPAWMPRLETQPIISTGPPSGTRRDDVRDPFARPAQNPQTGDLPPTLPPSRPVNQGWIPLPTPSSIIEPARQTPRVRSRDFGGADEDADGTRIAAPVVAGGARPGGQGWYARLDDGREVELTVTVLLGRNPQKGDADGDVHLVPAGGDGRMISRTHVQVGTDARGVFVVDRGSTNGTALVTTAGGLEPCPTGTQIRVREGQQVSYGNRWFTILRRPAQD
ncbi:MAG: RDD family protein [Arachnia sp.]